MIQLSAQLLYTKEYKILILVFISLEHLRMNIKETNKRLWPPLIIASVGHQHLRPGAGPHLLSDHLGRIQGNEERVIIFTSSGQLDKEETINIRRGN